MIRGLRGIVAAVAVAVGMVAGGISAQAEEFITVASTTSTQNSGLFGHLLPAFTKASGIEVRVVAVGTGAAIRLARNGDADVLLVHHKPSEEEFVAQGYGVARHDLMYNDFVVVGPSSDPAGVRGEADVARALARIAEVKAVFASRGDDSGTHKKERGLWSVAGVELAGQSGSWYRETGSGMGATLNTAAGMNAYTLSDRATWISFRNKADLRILVEGDKRLFNQYGVIRVSETRHPHVKASAAQTFIDWLVSPEGQKSIAAFTVSGQQLFTPNASG